MANPLKQNQIIQHMLLENIDILGVSETNLKQQESRLLHLHNDINYTYLFTSYPRQPIGTGVGFIIKKDISQHIFNHCSINGRMIYIDLHSKGKKVLRIIQLYLHSNKSQIKERCILQQNILTIIKQALSKHYHVIIMDDFNVNPMHR